MKSAESFYLPSLDHLRALAAFLVFYWHVFPSKYGQPGFVPSSFFTGFIEEGYSGVSLFICITGFIFTVLTQGKVIQYKQFLLNRFIRIFPLVFILTLYTAYALDTPRDQLFLFLNLLGGGTVYATWTLVIEFQFYIVYPFFKNAFGRMKTKKIVVIVVLLFILLYFFRLVYYVEQDSFYRISYGTMFGRAEQFIFGIMGGLLFIKLSEIRTRLLTGFLYAVWLTIVLSIMGFYKWLNGVGGVVSENTTDMWLFIPTIEGLLWSGFIVTYCLLSNNWNNFLSRALQYLGAISYSTYILHFLTLRLASRFDGDWIINGPLNGTIFENKLIAMLLLYYPFTVFVSACSYETFEKSFLSLRKSYLFREGKKGTRQ